MIDYPDRAELRAALKWWRATHPESLPVRPVRHPFFGWVLWGWVGEAGPVCAVMDAVNEYRQRATLSPGRVEKMPKMFRPERPDRTPEQEAAIDKLPPSGRIGITDEEFAADLEISGLEHLLKADEPTIEEE